MKKHRSGTPKRVKVLVLSLGASLSAKDSFRGGLGFKPDQRHCVQGNFTIFPLKKIKMLVLPLLTLDQNVLAP